MRFLVSLICALALLASSCKKNPYIPDAEPKFAVGGYRDFNVASTDTFFTIGTHDALILENKSENAESVQWNLGDGRTSTEDNFLAVYDKPGIYKVTLTAYGKNGKTSTTSELSLTVVERLLKSFSIDNLDINKFAPSQNGLPIFTTLNLWMEVKLSRSNFAFTSNGDILAPVVYKSPVFTKIDSSFHSSLRLTVPEKVLIDYPVNNNDFYGSGRGLVINLYGQDPSGTYLLASSAWSGISISVSNTGNPARVKTYDLQTFVAGSPTKITLNCEFK